MPTNTSNFGLLQPLVNNATDQDLWGGYLNSNIGNDDTLLLLAMENKTVAQTANFSVAGRTNGTTTTGSLRNLFLCNCTGGAITASLPAANSVDNGFVVAFKKTDSSGNSLTIDPSGSDTIDGAASLVVTAQYDSFVVVSDGTSNWNILSYKHGTAPKSFSVNQQVFTTPGSISYTPSAGLVNARIRGVAGGGAGGGSNGQGFGGGGAGSSGSYVELLLTAAQITAALSGGSIAGTVGIAGVGGSSGGGTGGVTSLTGIFSCPGGTGGTAEGGEASFSAGGSSPAAPTVTVGTVIASFAGQAGSYGYQNSQAEAGPGGSNPLGFGAPLQAVAPISTHQAAASGTGYGAGGGGCLNNAGDSTAQNGASGTPGILIIDEYIYA